MNIFIETGCSSLAVIKMWSFHGWIALKCSQFTKTSMNTIHSIVWKNHHYFSFIRLPNFGQWTILLWIFFGVIYLHRCFDNYHLFLARTNAHGQKKIDCKQSMNQVDPGAKCEWQNKMYHERKTIFIESIVCAIEFHWSNSYVWKLLK